MVFGTVLVCVVAVLNFDMRNGTYYLYLDIFLNNARDKLSFYCTDSQ